MSCPRALTNAPSCTTSPCIIILSSLDCWVFGNRSETNSVTTVLFQKTLGKFLIIFSLMLGYLFVTFLGHQDFLGQFLVALLITIRKLEEPVPL